MKSIKNILFLLILGISMVGNTHAKRVCMVNKLDHLITVSGFLDVSSHYEQENNQLTKIEKDRGKASGEATVPIEVGIKPYDQTCYNDVDAVGNIRVFDPNKNRIAANIERQFPDANTIHYVISRP